jgi:hypothetical protein
MDECRESDSMCWLVYKTRNPSYAEQLKGPTSTVAGAHLWGKGGAPSPAQPPAAVVLSLLLPVWLPLCLCVTLTEVTAPVQRRVWVSRVALEEGRGRRRVDA